MSLSLALNNALSGLNTNQRALGVLSQNIANANTKGYSRQIVDLSARYIEGVGQGVQVDSITRKVDEYLQRSIRTQSSDVSLNDVTKDYLDRAQILFGEPGQQNSLDEQITKFFNAVQAMAETPDLPSTRTTAVSTGITLARETSGLAYDLHDLRYQADRDISEGVKKVNDILSTLHTVNEALANATTLGRPIGGLLDQRDAGIRDLSEFLDVKTYFKEDGQVQINTNGGIPLLDDSLYKLKYNAATSIDVFIGNGSLAPLQVVQLTENGSETGTPIELISGGARGQITTQLTSGKLKALQTLRDTTFPGMIDQLDTFAAQLRDVFNAIHNDGSGYPSANALTGTREVYGSLRSDWSGEVRIGLVNTDGTPVTSPYADEAYTGVRPLTLDLSKLDNGFGVGSPTVQGIIDEINWHFGNPQNKAVLNNINDIRLVSGSSAIPGAPPQLIFDFELDNISAADAGYFVTNVTVLDDTAANITATTSTIPSFALNPAATFQTTIGSGVVTVNTAAPHTLSNGDYVYLQNPGVPVNGIAAGNLSGFFQVSNVTGTSFDIQTAGVAVATGAVGVAAQTALPKYDTIPAGEKNRTNDQGSITANLAGNPASTYYDIQVSVAVQNGTGQPQTGLITYRVINNQLNLLNDRFSATAAGGIATLVQPSSAQPLAKAILVDADGNELPKVNGNYIDEPGFLKIIATNASRGISIDELDSKQLGLPNGNPATAGSNRAFSHYFELNNFFKSNLPVDSGDTVAGSALNLAVEERLLANPTLITTGSLTRTRQPADPSATPLYTYERHISDNAVAQRLAKAGLQTVQFNAAGGLPSGGQTFNGYASQILGLAASNSTTAENNLKNGQILLEGFEQRSDSISGVNLDEELANTVIYQNAYTASARVITVTNQLFEALFNSL